jgi:2-polyprenyl-3-methyl-5-hydroxy-6-metoxy-1,4-benzoquinol methylase
MNITNPVYIDLKKNKLIFDENLIIISKGTRDSKVNVLKDKRENVIFLQKYITGHNYYSDVKNNDKRSLSNKSQKIINHVYTKKGNIITSYLKDDERRKKNLNKFFVGKDILDFGCGWGNFLIKIKNAKSKNGVEIGSDFIEYLKKKKIRIKKNILDFDMNFDYITLFHVLHYLPNQIETLKILKSKLKKKGKIIIEVPNANDFLLSTDEFKAFKNFTFCKEQLILHTEKSLKLFVKKAGFRNIKVNFYQRYNINNHFGWFLYNKPNGHQFLQDFFSKNIIKSYSEFLKKKKITDTLILTAQK